MIEVKELIKEFKIPVKQNGLAGAIRHIVHPNYIIKKAVNNVTFSVNQGEAVAYLGMNGAGKSTTIKMLTGILKPTSGQILVNGCDPQKDRVKNAKNIGVIFGQRTQLWWDIPVKESLKLLKNIYEISDKSFDYNLGLFHEIFGIFEFIEQPTRKLSLGQRMKADLAAALLHNPSIIFLDEPTIGLDIKTKEAMREFIHKINEEYGVTVILTSHDLADVENICRRIIIIDNGCIACDKEISKLMEEHAVVKKLIVSTSGFNQQILEKIKLCGGIEEVKYVGNIIEINFKITDCTAFVLLEIIKEFVQIRDFRIEESKVEDIIKNLYESGEQSL